MEAKPREELRELTAETELLEREIETLRRGNAEQGARMKETSTRIIE